MTRPRLLQPCIYVPSNSVLVKVTVNRIRGGGNGGNARIFYFWTQVSCLRVRQSVDNSEI